jgi:hypothetical protein
MTEPYDHDFQAEVSRAGYELQLRHGRNACTYARRQAERALAAGQMDEHRFWKAVAGSLEIR